MVHIRELAQQSWVNGVSAAIEDIDFKDVKGKCSQLEVTLNNNTNNVTATVTIKTANGGILYTKAAIPENASTVYIANSLGGTTDSDFKAFLASGDLLVDITPSGDPGTSGLTVDVDIYLED